MSARLARVTAIVLGVMVGMGVVVGANAIGDRMRAPSATSRTDTVEPEARPARAHVSDPAVMLVWSVDGIPGSLERRLRRLPDVRATTMARARLLWLTKTRSADGVVIDRAPGGAGGAWVQGGSAGIPFEVVGIRPAQFARFVLPGERASVATLGRSEILLARTAAALRRGGTGLELSFGSETKTVVGVLSDATAAGYEGLVRMSELPGRRNAEQFVLVALRPGFDRTRIDRHLAGWLSDRRFRSRLYGETPYLRYGDSVLPQLVVKREFGEFWAVPRPDGWLTIDPRWVEANVAVRDLPLVGRVACHRGVVGQLRAALAAVEEAGLSFAIDRGQWAGCFGARFINRDPTGRLSHHTWAIAIDLNVSSNPYGARPHQDRRIVRIFEEHGFTWGGRWLVPDGMHFEWVAPA